MITKQRVSTSGAPVSSVNYERIIQFASEVSWTRALTNGGEHLPFFVQLIHCIKWIVYSSSSSLNHVRQMILVVVFFFNILSPKTASVANLSHEGRPSACFF